MKDIWHRLKNPQLLISCLALLIAIATFVGTLIYLHNYVHTVRSQHVPIHRLSNVAAIEPWMTVHYIARAYRVPETELTNQLHISLQQSRHDSIDTLAEQHFGTTQAIIKLLQQTITKYYVTHPEARATASAQGRMP